jgi:hypothetical protein
VVAFGSPFFYGFTLKRRIDSNKNRMKPRLNIPGSVNRSWVSYSSGLKVKNSWSKILQLMLKDPKPPAVIITPAKIINPASFNPTLFLSIAKKITMIEPIITIMPAPRIAL